MAAVMGKSAAVADDGSEIKNHLKPAINHPLSIKRHGFRFHHVGANMQIAAPGKWSMAAPTVRSHSIFQVPRHVDGRQITFARQSFIPCLLRLAPLDEDVRPPHSTWRRQMGQPHSLAADMRQSSSPPGQPLEA